MTQQKNLIDLTAVRAEMSVLRKRLDVLQKIEHLGDALDNGYAEVPVAAPARTRAPAPRVSGITTTAQFRQFVLRTLDTAGSQSMGGIRIAVINAGVLTTKDRRRIKSGPVRWPKNLANAVQSLFNKGLVWEDTTHKGSKRYRLTAAGAREARGNVPAVSST